MYCSSKIVFFFFFFSFLNGFSHLPAQSITPFTFNNGGGSTISMEWSMGESVSISNFSGPGLTLNTGVLQPFTSVVTSIIDNSTAVFSNELSIGPIPTINIVHVKAHFKHIGNLSLQVLDAKSNLLQTHESGGMVSNFDIVLALDVYPAGIYYIRVYFKPIYGIVQSGIYKIIKI
jgi:hypothetical protein